MQISSFSFDEEEEEFPLPKSETIDRLGRLFEDSVDEDDVDNINENDDENNQSVNHISEEQVTIQANESPERDQQSQNIPQNMPKPHTNIFDVRQNICRDGSRRFLIVGMNHECNIFESFSELVDYLKEALGSRIGQHQQQPHGGHKIEPFWIDVQSPTAEDMEDIEKYFKLHKLTTEDCLDNDSGEKLEMFPNYLFVCIRTVDKRIENQFEELNVIVFKRFVITIHRGYFEEMELVLTRIETSFETGLTENEKKMLYIQQDLHQKYDIDRLRKKIQPATPEKEVIEEEEEDEGEEEEQYEEISSDGLLKEDDETLHKRKKKKKKRRRKKKDVEQRILEDIVSLYNIHRKRRVKKKSDQVKMTRIPHPSWILYAFLDVMTDMYVPLTEGFLMEVENVDELVLELKSEVNSEKIRMLKKLGTTKKQINRMKKLLITKNTIVQMLMSNNTLRYISNDISVYLRDVADHLNQCMMNLESAKESLNQSHSNYMIKVSIEIAKSSQQTDAIMNRITLFAAFLTPMALISGIWGMNMEVPGQGIDTLYWFWAVIGGMFFISGIILVFMSPQLIPDIVSRIRSFFTCGYFWDRRRRYEYENRFLAEKREVE